jgi:1,4-alpha-glucan branching enzyme
MKKYIIITFLLIFSGNLFAQIITTTPTLPTANQAVTIVFDATQGNAGLAGYTGDVYAHTGVITDKSTSGSDWQYVIADWNTNIAKAKMTPLGNDKYELQITPDIINFYGVAANDTVKKLAFVFRSADGSKTGKTASGGDIFVDVYQTGLNVNITTPAKQPYFVDANTTFDINAEATQANSITLFIDGTQVSTTTNTTLTYTATAAASGTHWIVAVAEDGTDAVRDSVYYVVRTNSPVAALPTGVRDGINYIDNQTVTLVLHAPYKNSIYAIGDFNNWTASTAFLMNKTSSDINDPDTRFWITLTNLSPGTEYAFQYLIDEDLKIAEPYTDKILDPWNDKYIPQETYPDLKPYPEGKTEGIVSVFQTAQQTYNWNISNFTPPAQEDLVVYELLVRDFTEKGNYQTLIDTIGYLKKLGINAIELMPINEFEGNDSWGYNPAFYFAVDKAYGTKDKFKEFVDVCHANGIAVLIDMVLNHSYGQSPLVQMYFDPNAGEWGQPTAQNPWYNETSPNTTYSWGYDFNHESPYTQAFVDSVNHYWISEYKVDGFRFDFTKGFTNTPGDGWAYDASRIAILKRMYDKIKSFNSNALVVFEHLTDNSEETELANYGILLWGNMNNNYSEASMGWNDNGKSDLNWAAYTSRGWNNPKLVTYMESHDEERMMYKNLNFGNENSNYSVKDLSTALKRIELATAFFLTIPGPKMIWQFGELGYDVSIDYNGRVGRKPVLWNYYSEPDRYRLFQVFQALIKLKKEEAVFKTTDFSMDVAAEEKVIHLNDASMNVTIIGNFDILARNVNPNFQSTGEWYDYFSGDTLTVSNTIAEIKLEAGEYRIYSDKKLDTPDIVTSVNKISTENAFNNVKVFPNPATSYTKIMVNADDYKEQVSINIYNIQGVLIKQLYQGKLNKGNNEFIWDLNSDKRQKLSQGIYFIRVQSKNQVNNMMIFIN